MKSKTLSSITILLVIVISACTKEITLNLPIAESKLVINGELNTEDNIKVQISRSLDILTNDSTYFINNATVELFEDGNSKGILNYVQQNYISTLKPKEGKLYKIIAKRAGFPTATANVVIPSQIGCTSKYTPNVGLDNDGFPYGQLEVKLTDNAAARNYYQFSIRYYDSSILKWTSYIITSEDPVFLNNTKKDDGSYLFSDATFSGQTKTLKFDISSGLTLSNITFEVSVKTFIEEYYRYLEQIADFKENGYNSSSAVIMRTNVTNGLGMVGGIYNIRDTIYSK